MIDKEGKERIEGNRKEREEKMREKVRKEQKEIGKEGR